jgi:hypothetical protein
MTTPAFVPLSFAPGEAYQFDWSHEIVVINGVTIRVKVAHVRLCHSRMLFVRAYPRESQEMVFRPWPSPPYQVFCRAHARGARHLSCEASAGVRRWIRSSSAASSTRDDGWMPQPTVSGQ